MAGQMLYGWDSDNNRWVKLKLDSDGSIHVVGYVDELNDIGDVDVADPTNFYILYWNNTNSKWECRALSDWTVPAHKDRHDPNDGADKLDTAIAVKVGDANAIGTSHSLARADHVHEKHHAKYLDADAVSAVEAAGLSLGQGKNIRIWQVLTTDHTFTGLTGVMIAGTAFTRTQACYVGADTKMELALATSAATMPAIGLAVSSITENTAGEFLLQGYFRDDTWDWTPGGLLYISKDTAGALTQTLPAASGEQVQVVGVAISADIIYFNPSYELVQVP